MKRQRATVGTISHGTLRPEDLIGAFSEELQRIANPNDLEAKDLLAEVDRVNPNDEFASELIDSLVEALEGYAPPYCYFGAIEGDGSDFGFWISESAVADARVDRELESGCELPSRSQATEFLVISDHGNMTLYTRPAVNQQWREVWGVI